MEPEREASDRPIFFSFDSNQTNGFLSPAFLSSFKHRNNKYNCSEQFFQAARATWFEDKGERYKAIMSATDPQEQKALGKHIDTNDNFWLQFWETSLEYVVMRIATRFKFTISEHASSLAQKLMATGHRELVMADSQDALWGIKMDLVAAATHVGPWPGENLLGEVLMDVRMSLRVEASLREERRVFSLAQFRVACSVVDSSRVETTEEVE